MKKLFMFLAGLAAVCVGTFAGCGVKNSSETFEDKPETQQIAQEDNPPEQKPDCDEDCKRKMPRVILKHGNAVGFFGTFSDGKFFIIKFGGDNSGEFGIYPEPLPTPSPDEQN